MLSTLQIISHLVRHKPTKLISDSQHCYIYIYIYIYICARARLRVCVCVCVFEFCLKSYGTGVLCEPWAKEGQADCVIILHSILRVYNSNLSFLQPSHFFFSYVFVYTCFSYGLAVNPE